MANHGGRIRAAVRSILKSTVAKGFCFSSPTRMLGLRALSSSPKKDVSDRLSGVIDAVNDRKLPPELRGQRNAVRSETDIINVVEQRIWHSMEEGQFENLPGNKVFRYNLIVPFGRQMIGLNWEKEIVRLQGEQPAK